MLSSYLDGKVFGTEFGASSPWILALHGWRRTHEDFAGVLAPPPSGPPLEAIAIDLPGFGASPPPQAAWGAEQYAEAISPLLDSMAERVVVVGHSFGGRVAIELAAARADRVGALILTGVPIMNPKTGRARSALRYRMIRKLAANGLIGARHLERARERYGSEDYRAAQGVMREVLVRVLAEDYRQSLSEVRAPIELIWGENDTVVPVAVARGALHSVPGAHLHVLPGVGHFVPTYAAAALREVVLAHQP